VKALFAVDETDTDIKGIWQMTGTVFVFSVCPEVPLNDEAPTFHPEEDCRRL